MSWTSENRLQKRHTVDRVLYKKDEEINLGLKSPLDLLAKHAWRDLIISLSEFLMTGWNV